MYRPEPRQNLLLFRGRLGYGDKLFRSVLLTPPRAEDEYVNSNLSVPRPLAHAVSDDVIRINECFKVFFDRVAVRPRQDNDFADRHSAVLFHQIEDLCG